MGGYLRLAPVLECTLPALPFEATSLTPVPVHTLLSGTSCVAFPVVAKPTRCLTAAIVISPVLFAILWCSYSSHQTVNLLEPRMTGLLLALASSRGIDSRSGGDVHLVV